LQAIWQRQNPDLITRLRLILKPIKIRRSLARLFIASGIHRQQRARPHASDLSGDQVGLAAPELFPFALFFGKPKFIAFGRGLDFQPQSIRA